MTQSSKKKQKKNKRRKSTTNPDIALVRRLLNSDLSAVHVIGGTVYPKPVSLGWDKIVPPYPKPRRDALITKCVEALENVKQDWTGYVFIFHLDENDAEYITTHEFVLNDVYPSDIDAIATKELDNRWFEADQSTKLSTAWVMIPDTRHTLDTEYSQFMDMFHSDGCWDRDKVKEHVDKRMKNNITIKITMDGISIDWAISNTHLNDLGVTELIEKVAFALTYLFREGTSVTIQIGELNTVTVELPDVDEDTIQHANLVLANNFEQASSLDNNIMFNVLRLAENSEIQKNEAYRQM